MKFSVAVSDAVKQKYGSGNTSLRQVAAGFRKIDFVPGTVNLDLGGGRFDEGTQYLESKGVKNLIFDPVNRSPEHNRKVFDAVKNGGVDSVTCNNVLNVIAEPEARDNVILQCAKALKPGGKAYFTVYEGNGSGAGRQSQADSYQNNRKTADYIEEIEKHFGDVSLKNKVITASDPKTEGKLSVWATDKSFENPLMFSVTENGKDGLNFRVTKSGEEIIRKSDDPEISLSYPERKAYNIAEAVSALKQIPKEGIVNLETGIKGEINSEQRNKLVSSKAREKSNHNGFTNEEHFCAVANIDRLFANGTLVDDRPDKNGDPNVLSIKKFVSPFLIGNEFAEAYITVKETIGHKVYSVELDELKKPSDFQGGRLDERYHKPEGYYKLLQKIKKARTLLKKNQKNSGLMLSVNDKIDAGSRDFKQRDQIVRDYFGDEYVEQRDEDLYKVAHHDFAVAVNASSVSLRRTCQTSAEITSFFFFRHLKKRCGNAKVCSAHCSIIKG